MRRWTSIRPFSKSLIRFWVYIFPRSFFLAFVAGKLVRFNSAVIYCFLNYFFHSRFCTLAFTSIVYIQEHCVLFLAPLSIKLHIFSACWRVFVSNRCVPFALFVIVVPCCWQPTTGAKSMVNCVTKIFTRFDGVSWMTLFSFKSNKLFHFLCDNSIKQFFSSSLHSTHRHSNTFYALVFLSSFYYFWFFYHSIRENQLKMASDACRAKQSKKHKENFTKTQKQRNCKRSPADGDDK